MAISKENRVRPAFALSIACFFIIFSALFFIPEIETWAGILALIAWISTLLFIGLKGYLDGSQNAISPLINTNWDLIPFLSIALGALATYFGYKEPGGVFLFLALFWSFIAPSWKALWQNKLTQFTLDLVAVIQLCFFILAIFVVIFG